MTRVTITAAEIMQSTRTTRSNRAGQNFEKNNIKINIKNNWTENEKKNNNNIMNYHQTKKLDKNRHKTKELNQIRHKTKT